MSSRRFKLTDDDCKEQRRRLELDAYSHILDALRIQGHLTNHKKEMLRELAVHLHIPIERQRSEIRRVVNDDFLNTVAEKIAGPNTASEWAKEGRNGLQPLHCVPAQPSNFKESDAFPSCSQADTRSPTPEIPCRDVWKKGKTRGKRKRKGYASNAVPMPHEEIQYFTNVPIKTEAPDYISTTESSPEMSDFEADNAKGTSATHDFISPIRYLEKPASSSSAISSQNALSVGVRNDNFALPTSFKSNESEDFRENAYKSSCDSQNSVPLEEKSVKFLMCQSLSSDRSVSECLSSVTSECLNFSDMKDNLPSCPQFGKFLVPLQTKEYIMQNKSSVGVKPKTQVQLKKQIVTSRSGGLNISPTTFLTKKLPSVVTIPHEVSIPVTSNISLVKSPASKSLTSHITTQSKQVAVTKCLLKPVKQEPVQFVTRPMFSTKSNVDARNLSPVVYNVSLGTSAKLIRPVKSDEQKTSSHLLIKSNPLGVKPAHFKLTASKAHVIQYKSDGGVIKNAKIVNLSQAIGSRAISSALALSSISTTTEKVLTAGCSNPGSTSRSIAKPNVILVHKAQIKQENFETFPISQESVSSVSSLDDSNQSSGNNKGSTNEHYSIRKL